MKIKIISLSFMIGVAGSVAMAANSLQQTTPKTPSQKINVTPAITLKDLGLTFTRAVSDTQVTQEKDNVINVTTNAHPSAYQLMSNPISVSKPNIFKITYEINLTKGGFGVGLLSADQSKWVVHQSYNTPGTVKGTIELPKGSKEKTVYLVFDNNEPKGRRSTFEIKKITLSK